ncbi:hypothetical protein, partial [Faecalibaculum rodentium]|uniref:hypothetical protein n=1 Tax=Faecalibaculum rodentium TaxID=1702221 RepID=UPI001C3CFF7E
VTKRAKIWRIRARKSGEAKLQDIIFIYSSPPEKYELLKTRETRGVFYDFKIDIFQKKALLPRVCVHYVIICMNKENLKEELA